MTWCQRWFVQVGIACLLWCPTWPSAAFDASWGVGLIVLGDATVARRTGDTSAAQEYGVQFPTVPIPVFAAPDKAAHGRVVHPPDARWSLVLERDAPMGTDVVEIAYESRGDGEFVSCAYAKSCLKVYQCDGDFVRVLRSVDGVGVWIRVTDLHQVGYLPMGYADWLVGEQDSLAALQLPERGITVREQPGFSSQKLVTIPSRQAFNFSLDFTGRINGLWAEVDVCYHRDRCEMPTKDPLYADGHCFSGWVKILDQQGFPNLWYNTEGC